MEKVINSTNAMHSLKSFLGEVHLTWDYILYFLHLAATPIKVAEKQLVHQLKLL